jgi:hypothetical protein
MISRWNRKCCEFNLFIITILILNLSLPTSSFKGSYFHKERVAVRSTIQRSSAALYDSNKSHDGDNGGASFTLSGTICGNEREYELDNLNCDPNRSGNEIQFCGELIIMMTMISMICLDWIMFTLFATLELMLLLFLF